MSHPLVVLVNSDEICTRPGVSSIPERPCQYPFHVMLNTLQQQRCSDRSLHASRCTLFLSQTADAYRIPGLPAGSQFVLIGAYLILAYGIGAPRIFGYMQKSRRKQLQQRSVMKSSGQTPKQQKKQS